MTIRLDALLLISGLCYYIESVDIIWKIKQVNCMDAYSCERANEHTDLKFESTAVKTTWALDKSESPGVKYLLFTKVLYGSRQEQSDKLKWR